MGVKGLWKLIESAGVPVPLETLEHKVLGVDVSIWLHQAVRGFRGPGGAAVANAHLLTLFHRICKLLFYRIRPVFVFDGGVPYLKKQTLASRKLKREVATNKARQVRERLLNNLLKSQAVRRALGKTGPGPSSVHVPRVTKKEKDLYELPPLPEALTEETSVGDEEGESRIIDSFDLPNLHHFDFESEEFKNMSLDMKHEILSELQGTRKQNSWATINDMPQQSENFADFQMARLMKRAKFQATLDSTRDEIQKSKVSEMEEELFGDLEKYVSLSRRIISEDASHAVFVKKSSSKSDPESVTVESDRKGKSLMKRKKPLDKDFLTELAKTGIILHKNQLMDSDSDEETDYHHSVHDREWSDKEQQSSKVEEESFLQVVGSLMENSGLTQGEILTLIQQDQRGGVDVPGKSEISDGPSTSANASGSIYNPDADSSDDDDDFIEVTDEPQAPQKDEDKKSDSSNNLDKLLGLKNDSLWMKIVQEKVNDMVHVKTLKDSPKKAIVDSRAAEKRRLSAESKSPKEGAETLQPVKISLDFEVKPLKMEDNIFSDIFADLVSQSQTKIIPRSSLDAKTRDSLSNGRTPKLTASSEANSNHINVNSCTGKDGSLAACSGGPEEVLHDEVEIMSSEDDSEEEENPGLSNQTHSPSSEHKNKDAKNYVPPKVIPHNNKETAFTSSRVLPENQTTTETDSTKNTAHGIKSTQNSTSCLPKGVNVPSTRWTARNGSSPARSPIARTTASARESDIDEGSVDDPLPLDTHTLEGSLKKANDTEKVTLHGTTDEHQEAKATPTSPSNNSGSSFDAAQTDATNTEHTSPASQMEGETNTNTGDPDDCLALQNVTDEDKLQNDIDEEEKEASSSIEESDIERPLGYTEDELKHLEGELASEQQALVAEAQQSERVAASLNDQMYGESQYLLQLFGIPYLVAPMEAEAQCAFLNGANLTEGTITDDSDIFLFGGDSVYRNFFNQARHVEHFKVNNIKSTLGLDRPKMITLSLLSGSDYTEGIEGIGSVSGMEVLAEFPGEGIECLKNLKKWWNVAHKGVSSLQPSKVKQKLVQVSLPESFPSESVYEAYVAPEVDESREKFSWAVPNVEALRNFTGEKFGWNHAKADEILLPVMKKLKLKTTQKRIESYFTNIRLVKEPKVASKRMQEAIAKARGIKLPESDRSPSKPRGKPRQRKKVVKDVDTEAASEGNEASGKVLDPKPSTPRRTLLVDPSEVESKSVTGGQKGRKRKKDAEDVVDERSRTDSEEEEQHQAQLPRGRQGEEPPRKLTKEEMFKSLLEKETICQREKDQLEMQEKKLAAAQVLKKQKEKTKRR